MTTLADVNATLGAQNLALSEVVKAQKQTNTGISSFLEHIKKTDARERREDLEDDRETKKASVLGKSLSAVGSAAGSGLRSTGRGLLSVGQKGFGAAKSGLRALKGIGPGFLGGLLSSKLIRFGIPGLAFFMGDEIADFIIGPNGSGELKKQLSGAIKGGAIGSLLGPRFGLLGMAIGGLLADDKINTELGIMTEKINDLVKKLGIKDGLAGLFQKITKGIGIGLESINKLLSGQVNLDNILKGGALIGGIATLLMPGKLLGMAFKAGRLLLMTPIGRAILLAAGGFKLIQSILSSGGQTGNDARFMTGPEGDFDYGKQSKNIEAGKKDEGMKIPGIDGEMSTLDQTIAAMMAGQLVYSGGKFIAKKGYNMMKGKPNLKPEVPKQPRNIFKSILDVVKSGGRHAMTMVRGLPVLLPLAAVAGLTYVLNNKESSEDLKRKTTANKLKGIMTPEGIKAGINIHGGGGMEMDISDGTILSDSPAYKKKFSNSFFAKPVPQAPTLSDYFARNRLTDGMSPGAMGGVVVDNSNSNNVVNNQSSAAMFNGALNGHDLGDQVSLKQQLKLVSPSFQGF